MTTDTITAAHVTMVLLPNGEEIFMTRGKPPAIAIATLGCKVNQCDSAGMDAVLKDGGYHLVPFTRAADVYIINTCTVTEKTDAQSRQLIRRALKANPRAQLLVTGCYAQHAAEAIASLSPRIQVLGNPEKTAILTHVKQLLERPLQVVTVSDSSLDKEFYAPQIPRFLQRTRAYLKIQDGCNARCTYCIVPQVRGPSRSLPLKEVLKRFQLLASSGYKEVVLTGIHLGAYGLDLTQPVSLIDLLWSLAAEESLSQIRVRLSSIEPTEISDELIQFLSGSAAVCQHLHLPLQSGDESILRAMNRPYTPAFFKSLIEKLVSSVKGIHIGIDVIAGFPGESDEQFQNTVRFIEELPVGYLHVFPYSKRPGTPAASSGKHTSESAKKERARQLREVGISKRKHFYSSFLGKTLPVLVEGRRDRITHLLRGFSKNYIPVLVDGPDESMGKEIPVRVTEVRETNVYGEIAV